MQVLTDPSAFRAECDRVRGRSLRLGLVLTMGALHEGHASLIRAARAATDIVAATVFVNPTQFGPNEDFSRYPRTLDADTALAAAAGAEIVFAPDARAMYPEGEETRVVPGPTAEPLCGAFRPGHFQGVVTVVTKFFALAGPCTAAFGKKDYQQLRVIQRLVTDLLLPIDILPVPTVREPDGLAMSSRNRYLAPAARAAARAIPLGLSAAHRAFAAGERSASALTSLVRAQVAPAATSIDYIDIATADSVRVFAPGDTVSDRAVLALAARFEGARLIDNVVLGEDPAPIPA
ncbi:MAG: pantoate--beta-alanine ligase [Polyangiaceae bacterium]